MTLALRLILVSTLLAGCERAGFAAANLPTQVGRVAVTRDVAYGPKPWQKLDIYAPKAPSGAPRDTLVFFYGGRWSKGARADYPRTGS